MSARATPRDRAAVPTWAAVRLVVRETCAAEPVRLRGPRDVADLIGAEARQRGREAFWCVYLDIQRKVIHIEEVTTGTLDSALVHAREIFQGAILANAAAVILAHNHPSGDPTPSAADRQVTGQLHAAGKIIGIEVLDHIVIGHDGRYVSFTESGFMP